MGYAFDETMSGTMTRTGSTQEVPFTFSVHVECEGTMTLRPVRGRIVRYELSFRGDDGKSYRFAGQKDIRWLDALRTWTTLPGEITDANGKLVARCDTRFDYKSDWMQFVTSWKPA